MKGKYLLIIENKKKQIIFAIKENGAIYWTRGSKLVMVENEKEMAKAFAQGLCTIAQIANGFGIKIAEKHGNKN